MSRVHGGAGIKHQEFADGWVYEVYTPVSSSYSVVPRGKTVKILFIGQWIGAFNEEGINYLTVWVPRAQHEGLFPDGPPAFRAYDEDAKKVAADDLAAWLDPNETNPGPKTREIKLVELARLEARLRQLRRSQQGH